MPLAALYCGRIAPITLLICIPDGPRRGRRASSNDTTADTSSDLSLPQSHLHLRPDVLPTEGLICVICWSSAAAR